MRISDWSSDVCSSDLALWARIRRWSRVQGQRVPIAVGSAASLHMDVRVPRAGAPGILPPAPLVHPCTSQDAQERPQLEPTYFSLYALSAMLRRHRERTSTRLNSSHSCTSRMPSSA